KWRQARFAGSAGRLTVSCRHDVDIGDQRRLIDTHDREVVEVALLHPAVLEGDLAVFRKAQAHDGRSLDLRLDPLRIDEGSAIDRGVHTLDAELAFAANRDLDDGGNVTDKAPMGRDAKPVSLGHRTAPTAFLSDQLDHASQP